MAERSTDPAHAKPVPATVLAKDADAVAPRLLGCLLQVRTDGGVRHARIVETEAYLGEHDLACHAAKGRTPRSESLYGPPGSAYVYLVYGLHRLFNVVVAARDDPQAVLIRAVEPLDFEGRTHGPGLLSAALGIELSDDRSDLARGRIRLLDGAAPARVAIGPRVGVDYAGAWAEAPLRFGDADSPRLSRRFPAA
jgi:DNA-3-methyladenine glycosylase